MKAPTPTAQELKTEMAKAPSLDQFFVNNPKSIDMEALMNRHRQDRAVFISKGEMTRTPKDEE